MSATLSAGRDWTSEVGASVSTPGQSAMSWAERCALLLGIFEIPLQLDKYLGYRELDGSLGAVAGLNVSLTTMSLVFLYLAWMGSLLTGVRSSRGIIVGIPMLLYLSAVAFSSLSAEYTFLSFCDLFLLSQAYLLFFYIVNRIQTKDDYLFLVFALGSVLVFQGLVCAGLAACGPAMYGREITVGKLVFSVWSEGRVASTMQSAVLAGSTLAVIWLPVLGYALTRGVDLLKLVARAAIVLGMLGILSTQTRGAIGTACLSAAVLGLAMLVRGWLSRSMIMMGVLGALMAMIPLAIVVQKRVLSDDQGSADSRRHLTAIAVDTIAERPILGHGAGNCHRATYKYANQSEYHAEWFYTIHNKFLVTWIETGIFGLLAFFFVLFNGLRQGLTAWRLGNRLFAPIGLAVMLAIAGHMLHMCVDIFNSRTQVQILWVVLGLAALTYRFATEYREPSNPIVEPS